MPAATNKADLLAVTRAEFAKLRAVVDGVPAGLATVKDGDDTAIKDVVAHRAHWILLFLDWYAQGQALKATGGTVVIPAPGYKWNDLKRYNADLRAAQAGLDWAAARGLLDHEAQRLLGFLEATPEAELYGGPMPGGGSKWTTGRWAEAAGASHYRSATKYIRGRVKAAA